MAETTAETGTARAPAPVSPMTVTPLWLPASYFATGLAFYAAAAVLLPFVAGDIAAGRFLLPRVVALVHLITLGWLTISIMGALCQLFPVALATPLRWPKLALATLVLYAPGLVLFMGGLLGGHTLLIVIGTTVFATALLLFIANGIGTLARAPKRELTWWALAFALFFLLATIAFGASLAGNLHWNFLRDKRLAVLAIHMHVALGGWVLLVVMGVGRRLLPMFLLSPRTDERAMRVAMAATATGALVLSVLHPFMTHALFAAGTSLIGVGLLALIVQMMGYVRSRARPQLDAGLRMVVFSAVLMVSAVVLGEIVLFTHAPWHVVSAYGVAALGGLALFVAGHYYKILPFLIWNHRYAPLVGKRPLPKIVELYDARWARAASALSIAAMAILLIDVLLGVPLLAIGAGVLFLAGVLIEVTQLVRLLARKVA